MLLSVSGSSGNLLHAAQGYEGHSTVYHHFWLGFLLSYLLNMRFLSFSLLAFINGNVSPSEHAHVLLPFELVYEHF
jgi:hypothetical protein